MKTALPELLQMQIESGSEASATRKEVVSRGGLEPPTRCLRDRPKRTSTEYDGLLSRWFSAPVQAILTPTPLLPFAMVSDWRWAQNRAQPH